MKKSVSLLATLFLLAACGKKAPFSPEENTGVQIASQVSIFESKGSQQQWLLTAEAVDFADLSSATLKNPVLLLKQNGTDSARVTGDSGTFDYAKKLVTISGGATIHSLTERTRIVSDTFSYDINRDRVWSERKTTVTRGTAKAVAKGGIETDSKLTKITLKKHTTRVPVSASELKR